MGHTIKGTPFKLVGITADNKPVVAGLYDMYQTHGFPLDMLVDHFENKGWAVSTLDLACEMFVAGVKPGTIPGRVAGLFESHSPDWRATVTQRLQQAIPQ